MPRLSLLFLVVVAAPGWSQKVDFNRDVRPILSDNCFACHGPDDKARKADLRLDTRAGAARVIDVKNPAKSDLIARLLTEAKAERMPPEKTGKTLSKAQVETLKQWVAQGAEYQAHWSFIAPSRPSVPKESHPIDFFIEQRLAKEGLNLASEVERPALIRRVTLDLTGLPPTPAEVDAFVADKSPDAYEKVVARLLGSIRHGERLALDWMDAARYADTNGYHIDNGRDMTKWREWVIDAFHKNKRFDEFTVEQLAGDLLPKATTAQKIASGFNRNHMINFEGGAIPEEYHTAYIIDRVNTTATVWMGLSVACAQCHDHKYDPISQKDFYRLYAFFNNVPERGLDGNRGNSVPLLKVPTADQQRQLREWRAEIATLDERMKGPLPKVEAAQAAWEKAAASAKTAWTPLALTNLWAANGATLSTVDGVSVASGTNAATETYAFTIRPQGKITALRLDVLPDDALAGKGPGRSVNGNFVMTGFKVSAPTPIKPKSASASFSQVEGGFDIATLLTGGNPGWAILPQTGRPHHAVFAFAEPLPTDRDVTVSLEFNSRFPSHQFARFKLSATDSDTPHEPGGLPPGVAAGLRSEKRTASQQAEIASYYRTKVSHDFRELVDAAAALSKRIADLERVIPDAMVMEEMPKPRDTFVLTRGEYDKRGEKVTAGTPPVLPPLDAKTPNRLDLAKWLVSPDHPLTARVTVNRYWQMFFGTGLVKSAEDFGTQGDHPSHPELLDWLAVEFRESGWDLRKLLTLIVTSRTYRQSAVVTKEAFARDPENRLLARGPRFRLQAEFLRDQSLAISGLLNGEVGGKSVSPYQPSGLWEELMSRSDGANWTAQTYKQSTGKDLYRRTMYTFWKRTCPPASLATLDAPDRETCVVRRSRTNTPLQALVLMNDPTYVEASRKLAERMMKEGGDTPEGRIAFAFKLATARTPTPAETSILRRVHESQHARYAKDKPAADKLLRVGESPRDDKLDAAELAAWSMVANAILNLDEVVSK